MQIAANVLLIQLLNNRLLHFNLVSPFPRSNTFCGVFASLLMRLKTFVIYCHHRIANECHSQTDSITCLQIQFQSEDDVDVNCEGGEGVRATLN